MCSSHTLWRRFTRLSVCPRCVTRGHPGGRSPRFFLLPHGSFCSTWVGFIARRVQSSRALVDPQEVCILRRHVVFHRKMLAKRTLQRENQTQNLLQSRFARFNHYRTMGATRAPSIPPLKTCRLSLLVRTTRNHDFYHENYK